MTKAYECDRCKKVFTEVRGFRHFTSSSDISIAIWPPSDRKSFDLCNDCLIALFEVITHWWDFLGVE